MWPLCVASVSLILWWVWPLYLTGDVVHEYDHQYELRRTGQGCSGSRGATGTAAGEEGRRGRGEWGKKCRFRGETRPMCVNATMGWITGFYGWTLSQGGNQWDNNRLVGSFQSGTWVDVDTIMRIQIKIGRFGAKGGYSRGGNRMEWKAEVKWLWTGLTN